MHTTSPNREEAVIEYLTDYTKLPKGHYLRGAYCRGSSLDNQSPNIDSIKRAVQKQCPSSDQRPNRW